MDILIADDHAAVRRGLKEILADAVPRADFSECCNGNDVLGKLAACKFDLLILDINMPGRSGFDVLQDVTAIHPLLPVIIVSVQPDDQYAPRCLKAGAAAYVNKDSASEKLAQATRRILGREHSRMVVL